ncbi:unnamed protein product [Parnassius apollo]|uniref:(apollo) hypothetical protein n=1 Tax=Parnassius apollo TaxID=110799 RepID=A0A8S3X234_PARAO|nr:unnamed protein product [Parnassius apollo]
MAQEQREREVITELLELYRDLPCLWDLTCETYKDSTQKKNAWDILATKLKEIDTSANATSAKKKEKILEFLIYGNPRSLPTHFIFYAFQVKESKNRTGSSTSDVHKPSLWYYELLTFLEKKNDVKRKGIDSLMGDEEDEQQIGRTNQKS